MPTNLLRIIAFTYIMALSLGSVSAMDQTDLSSRETTSSQNRIIQEIVPNKLYASTGSASTGEPIYFGMEFIDQTNFAQWTNYQKLSHYRTNFYFSPRLLSKEDRLKYFKNSGYEQKEYEEFCDSIYEKVSQRSEEMNSQLKEDFRSAIGAFDFMPDDGYYVAYISKMPVTSYFSHPAGLLTLKTYHEGYKNLLMCVRCKDIANTAVYNNRGIFKGLRCLVDGGYGGLALKLHGFTGAVFETKGKTHMSVAPLPKMYEILESQIPQDKLLTGSNIPADLNHFDGLFGGSDTRCVIDIPTLKSNF